MKPKIRVLIVDDSITIRAMISALLENDPELSVVGIAADVLEANVMIRLHNPDAVTLDIEMPGTNGIAYLRQLKRTFNKPVIMLSSHAKRGTRIRSEAMRSGADACFNKANAVREAPRLIKIIKQAVRGTLKLDAEDLAAKTMVAA